MNIAKMKVILHRQRKDQPGYGEIRAYVKQEGRYGSNLLRGHQITSFEKAKSMVREIIDRKSPGTWVEFERSACSPVFPRNT